MVAAADRSAQGGPLIPLFSRNESLDPRFARLGARLARMAAMDLQYHDMRPEKSLFARLGIENLVDDAEAEIANGNGAMLARAKNLANAHVFEGGTDEVNKQLDHYLAVKREDLQRVAKKYLNLDAMQIVAVGDAAKIRKRIEKLEREIARGEDV